MARRTFDVVDVTEIFIHWYAGRSINEVSASLGVDRKTIRKYLAPAVAAGLAPGGPAMAQQDWAALVTGWFPQLVPVESLHPFVLRETKCFLLDLDAPSSSGLPGAWESHSQEQCWLPHHHPPPTERLIIADIRYAADRAGLLIVVDEVVAEWDLACSCRSRCACEGTRTDGS